MGIDSASEHPGPMAVDRSRPSWPALLAFGLATRVVVLALGCLLAHFDLHPIGEPEAQTVAEDRHDFDAEGTWSQNYRHLIEPWYHFDALWYAHVSQRGYRFTPGKASSVAFMPLLPAIMSGGAAVGLDRFWVGLIVPNLAFAVGLAAFGRMTLRATGDAGTAWKAIVLLVAYPWSFFFSCPYQESLGFALTALAILAWLDRRPLVSAGCIALASTSRVVSVALSAAVLAEWAVDLARRRRPRHWAWLVALGGFVGIGAFCAYLDLRVGDPSAYFKAHASWGRRPASLENTLHMLLPGSGGLKNYSVMILFLALGLRAWIRRGTFWGVLILLPILMAMSTGSLMSLGRLALSAFPAFIDAAELLRHRGAFWAAVALGIAVQILFISMHCNRIFVA